MRRGALACALAFLATTRGASAQVVQREPWRPPPFEPSPSCDVWLGTGTGNDPSKLLEIQLCGRGRTVVGRYQTSSKVSGYSVREISGEWDSKRAVLVLHELRITEDKPEPGWRFCAADVYRLKPSADPEEMTGDYESEDCHDFGALKLRLDHTIPLNREVRRRDRRGPPASDIVVPPTAPVRSTSGCACASGAAGRGGAMLVLATAGLAASLRRARRPLRASAGTPRAP